MRFSSGKSHITTAKLAAGLILLGCGCVIYLLFRSTTIALYQAACAIGLGSVIDHARMQTTHWVVPDFILFSLPDGLYCLSYVILIDALWPVEGTSKAIAASVIPAAAVIHETGQGMRMVRGTFDAMDLCCYLVPWMLYLLYYIYYINLSKFKQL